MGSYASLAVRDSSGTIIGYQSTSTGQIAYESAYPGGQASANYNSIVAAYGQQHYTTVGSSSGAYQQSQGYSLTPTYYDTSSAAGIAAQVGRYGALEYNPLSGGVALTAIAEGYNPNLVSVASATNNSVSGYAVPITSVRSLSEVRSGIDVAPTFDKAALAQGAALTVPASAMTGGTVTTYVPNGNYAQTELLGTKDIINPISGEIAIYQLSAGGYYYKLIGGGGSGALQSGDFTVNYPETSVVYTQNSAGKALAAIANATEAAKVLGNTSGYSRLGSEVYGGYVVPLTGKTVAETGAQLSTYSNTYNLANLVSPQGVNLSKADMGLVSFPWTISPGTSAISTTTGKAITGYGSTKYIPSIQIDASEPITVAKSDLGTISGLKIISATPAGSVDVLGSTVPGSYSLKTTTTPGTAGNDAVSSFINAARDAFQTEFINPINSVIGTKVNIEPDYGSTNYLESYQTTLPTPFVSNAPEGYTPSQITFDITSSKTIQNKTGIQSVSSYLGSQLPELDYNPAPTKQSGNFFINGDTGGFGIGSDYTNAFVGNALQSGYSTFREDPIQFGATSGFWAGVTIATMGVGDYVAASAAGSSRLAGAAMSLSPYLKGALAVGYGAEAVWVTTEGLTEFSPSRTGQNFGKFAEESIAPMIVGGLTGGALYNAGYGNLISGARSVYEGTNFPRTPTIDDVRFSVSESIFGVRQRLAGIENIGSRSGSPFYTESGNFYPMDTFAGNVRTPEPTTPSGYGGVQYQLPNLKTTPAALLPDLSVKGYSFGSNPSIIETAFEGDYSFTSEQNRWLVDQMAVKDIGYGKGYGTNTLFDRPDVMASNDRIMYQSVQNTMSIQDQIRGNAFVQSQMPKYPLLESSSAISTRSARNMINGIPDVSIEPTPSGSFWDWQSSSGRYTTYRGFENENVANSNKDTLSAWRGGQASYKDILSPLQEQSLSERNVPQKRPYKSAESPPPVNIKTFEDVNLPEIRSNQKESKYLGAYDAYIKKYGEKIPASNEQSPGVGSYEPRLETQMAQNEGQNPYTLRNLKYAEPLPYRPLEIKTEPETRNEFMAGWNEAFRYPDPLTALRIGKRPYWDLQTGQPAETSLSERVYGAADLSISPSTKLMAAPRAETEISQKTETLIVPVSIARIFRVAPDIEIVPVAMPTPYATPSPTGTPLPEPLPYPTAYPPSIPIPPIPKWPTFPDISGVGGSGFGIKRRRNFLETFRMGLDISSRGTMNLPKGMTMPKGLKLPKAPKLRRRR